MAAGTLADRVRAAVADKPAVPAPVVVPVLVEDATSPEELRAAEQAEGGQTTAAVMRWLDQYGPNFTEALPACVDRDVFMAAVRAALPSLTRCTPASLLQALLTCARFGLIPDGRQAVVTCEAGRAVFIPMYQGYVELMYRSGRVKSVHADLIYAGDEWSIEPAAPVPLDFVFKPARLASREERGEPVLAYAFAWLENGARSQVVTFSRADAEAIRDEYSRAYQRAEEQGSRDSFWHTHFDAMWRKTALRGLFPVVPTSAEVIALTRAEDAGDAGRVQVLHVPDEDAQAVADAEAAHDAAEGSQESQEQPIGRRRRVQPKRTTRKSRRGKGSSR